MITQVTFRGYFVCFRLAMESRREAPDAYPRYIYVSFRLSSSYVKTPRWTPAIRLTFIWYRP